MNSMNLAFINLSPAMQKAVVGALSELLPHAWPQLEGTAEGREILGRARAALSMARSNDPEYPSRYVFRAAKPLALEPTDIYRNGVQVGHYVPYWSSNPNKLMAKRAIPREAFAIGSVQHSCAVEIETAATCGAGRANEPLQGDAPEQAF